MCNHLLRFVEGKAGPIGFNGSTHHGIKKDFLYQFFITCWEGQTWKDGFGWTPNYSTRGAHQAHFAVSAGYYLLWCVAALTAYQVRIWNSSDTWYTIRQGPPKHLDKTIVNWECWVSYTSSFHFPSPSSSWCHIPVTECIFCNNHMLLLLLLSRFSRVRLCVTP